MSRPEDMWQCQTVNCGYIYDPDRGDRKGKIPKGVKFEDLPETWRCPICGGTRKCFRPLAGPGSTLAEGCELPTTPPKPAFAPRYHCATCGYIYDPDKGDRHADIAPGTPFSGLPPDWVCPICGAGRTSFTAPDAPAPAPAAPGTSGPSSAQAARYVCTVCGYVFDTAEGGAFADLPADWACPVCGADKSAFAREG